MITGWVVSLHLDREYPTIIGPFESGEEARAHLEMIEASEKWVTGKTTVQPINSPVEPQEL